jgi:hypothetical protein
MAHLKALETRYDGSERKTWKLYLTRQLYEKGHQREDVLNLFRVIDWLMQLPQELEQEFWQAIEQYEAEKRMSYITSVERIGIEQGNLQGRREAVIEVLEACFGIVAQPTIEVLENITDVELLKVLLKRAISVGSVDEFQVVALEHMNNGSQKPTLSINGGDVGS